MKILKYGMVAVVICCCLPFLFYPPKYVYRLMVWQDASYEDFKKMPSESIEKSETPFNFVQGSEIQQNLFKEKVERVAEVENIDQFLEDKLTYACIVIRNDTILYEKYFDGNTRDQLQTSFSSSKSILSLLIGFALKDGLIISIDQPITDYLPELTERDDHFKRITIGDLLRMRSGLKYDGGISFPLFNCDDPLTYYHTDLKKVALEYSKIETPPDQSFKYNNYNPLLLGLILERATGVSTSEFLEKKLWSKIGAEYNASWSTDDHSFSKMESGFNARPIDMAKIGRLILKKGKWEGTELLDANWIDQSTVPVDTLVFRSGHKWGYSHMWWSVVKDSLAHDIFACGRFGQFIYISPSDRTIIVRHGLETKGNDDTDWTKLFSKLIDE